ncbi:MAG: hypothetical protein ACOX4U_05100 [Anaerovoracaceae bacterium]|jgi:hypothetical protein
MNTILGFDPLVIAIITIAALIAICFFNMYVLVKHRRSYYTVALYIASFFAVCWLFFHMMGSAVFVLPLCKIYYRMAGLSFIFMWISVIVGLVVVFLWGRKRNYQHLSPNIQKALSCINDIVFVVDRDGEITNINHPKKFASLFGSTGHINQLISFMESNCPASWEYGKEISTIKGTVVCELELHNSTIHYLLKITPIEMKDGSRLGYTAVLEDISAAKSSEKLLQAQNDDLKQANERLSNYVRVAGALDAEKERLNILEHVQSTLISDIEKILLNFGKVKQSCFTDGSYPDVMRNVASQLRQVYSTVRHAVGEIAGKGV